MVDAASSDAISRAVSDAISRAVSDGISAGWRSRLARRAHLRPPVAIASEADQA